MNERFLSYGKSIYNALRNQPYAITTTIITWLKSLFFSHLQHIIVIKTLHVTFYRYCCLGRPVLTLTCGLVGVEPLMFAGMSRGPAGFFGIGVGYL